MINLRPIRKASRGFTVLELMVILVIIGILAAVIFTTYAGIKESERNTTRQNDVTALKKSLELYYTENQKYPSLTEINDTDWRTQNMPTLDPNTLRDPSSNTVTLSAQPSPHMYAYIVKATDGSNCDNATKLCASYTLTATLEGGGTYSKSSLN